MLVVAVVGVLANLAGLLVLRPAQAKSLNVRGAYLEVSVTSSVRWLSSPPLC
jgi:cobalt-zinc-cadmium efflux system protein